jgi:hypothetical protein
MATPARQLRRLQVALDDAQEMHEGKERALREALAAEEAKATDFEQQVRARDKTIFELEAMVAYERLQRVSAQRGLVAEYHTPCQRCGQTPVETGIVIGYDPDLDPEVQADIQAGKIPPRRSSPFREEIRREGELVQKRLARQGVGDPRAQRIAKRVLSKKP